jgi:uncharacterized short protein YbdD (DUF466 family)
MGLYKRTQNVAGSLRYMQQQAQMLIGSLKLTLSCRILSVTHFRRPLQCNDYVAYVFHARTVEPQKQPLLSNTCTQQ